MKKIFFHEKPNFCDILQVLHIVSTNGSLEVCSLLLKKGANVNEYHNNHSTPLHYYHEHKIFKLLISFGTEADMIQKK